MMQGRSTLMAWGLGLTLSCGGAGEQGAPGPAGPQGPAGPMGAMGTMGPPGADASTMFANCPIGYTRDNTAANIVLCKKGSDEVVRVGKGGSAFWIDRYEASVFDNEDGSGTQYGTMSDSFPIGFPKNGQVTMAVYAISKASVRPSTFLTWFQANEACRAAGKRLPTGSEWTAAARGTTDPGANGGADGSCANVAGEPRNTGGGTACQSSWGAQDMVGNVWEITDDWAIGVGQGDVNTQPWPAAYNDDGIYNIASKAEGTTGRPSFIRRGGSRGEGAKAGIFALAVSTSPADNGGAVGFRCVVPR